MFLPDKPNAVSPQRLVDRQHRRAFWSQARAKGAQALRKNEGSPVQPKHTASNKVIGYGGLPPTERPGLLADLMRGRLDQEGSVVKAARQAYKAIELAKKNGLRFRSPKAIESLIDGKPDPEQKLRYEAMRDVMEMEGCFTQG